ncbi:MAG: hypothetical protein AAB225_01215 [Acidobacteriota bacterium]
MLRILVFLLSAMTGWAAEDAWAKVRELKSGAELRIYKKGAKQPVLAKRYEATEESLVVVVKNEQLAIPKDEIERIDARPVERGSRITRETKVTGGARRAPRDKSISTNINIGSRPDFETVYKRSEAAPPK